ncbi:hypothetical protein GCM10022254_25810 [Actinomadura meridiana]|uniref:Uncharacterized protein n=1 Tax=Actinomadura meridiana TaxID=559626 RepID=A0ABP8BYP5_9ACTN
MIILSGVLVVVAIAILVAGIVASNGDSAQVFGYNALDVIYVSIAVSIAAALCLAVGVFLRRRELFGPGAATAPARKSKKGKRTEPAPPVRVPNDAKSTAPGPGEMTIPSPPVDVPADALVFVVRGRKRYHLDTCRQLAGRDTEELTYAEAKEEGFSPCTACLPDTALAARAAASAPASPGAGKAAGDKPIPPRPGAEPPKNALAGLANPAPERSAPGPLDKTAEIPRADKKPADPKPVDSGPAAPKPEPAGPTLTDMPVAGLAPKEAAKPAEKAEPAEPEPESPSTGDQPAQAASEGEKPSDEGPQVRILSGTKRYHRVDCALIQDIGDDADDLEGLSRAEAKSRGCTPCLVCEPDREHARD